LTAIETDSLLLKIGTVRTLLLIRNDAEPASNKTNLSLLFGIDAKPTAMKTDEILLAIGTVFETDALLLSIGTVHALLLFGIND